MALSKKQRRKLAIQFGEYLLSGGMYFWVGYALLDYLYYGEHWSLWWATIVSNVVGWTVNFTLQRYWVFNSAALKNHTTEVTGRYIFITLVDFILNYFILYGLRQIGVTPAIGQFISSGFFTIWNYAWYKLWVFPEKVQSHGHALSPVHVLAHRAHGHSAYHRSKV